MKSAGKKRRIKSAPSTGNHQKREERFPITKGSAMIALRMSNSDHNGTEVRSALKVE